MLLVLAVVAISAGAAVASGASFVTTSSTSVQASTSALSSDEMTMNGDLDDQIAVAGIAVPLAPSVAVEDGNGNPVSGLTVTFAVTGGGGRMTGSTAVTDDDGIATVGSWTLGSTPGKNTLVANCTSGVLGSPVTFTATGIAGTATAMVINAGDNQQATAGSSVVIAPSVKVTDAGGNPVSGIDVTFAVALGGGSVTTGAAARTNAAGIAAVTGWRLGVLAGANSLTATCAGLSGSPLTFIATGVSGAAGKMTSNAGNGQTVHVGTAVTIPPSVLVTDANNNPVGGVAVAFAIGSGSGSITGSPAMTNAAGIATVGSWTLGTVAGANSLTASSPGLTGSPVTFTATGLTGSPTTLAILSGGANQNATVGTAVGTVPSARVTDAYGNTVPGAAVTFAVVSGGGSTTGASTTTDAFGVARIGSWTLGITAGVNTLTATSPGLTGSPLTYAATGLAGTPIRCVVTSSNYSPPIGSPVTITAQIADQYGNPVAQSGQSVLFSKNVTGGSLGTPNPATTGPTGAATLTLTTGSTVGTVYRVTGFSAGRTGTTPDITTIAGTPTRIAMNSGNGQTATVNTAVATAPSVLVTDAFNNPVAGVAVTFAVAPGSGSVTGASGITNASGVTTVGNWTLGTTAGANTLTATSAGLTGSPVAFTATGLAGPATKYVVTSSSYGPVAGTAITLTAQLADQYGNPVATSGLRVRFSRSGTGGSFSSTRVNTNAGGIATTTFTTSTTAGRTYTFTARSTRPSTRTGTSAAVTTVPGAATTIALSAGNGQTATAGSTVATAPAVRVTDSRGNGVPGVAVTFTVGAGGGSVTATTATTNATGIATVGWMLGTTAGANTLTATRAGLAGSPVAFTATGVAGAATQYLVTSSSYGPSAGTSVTITARLADQYGNAVAASGIWVTFTKTGTGGAFVAANPAATNASGTVTITLATAGTVGTAYAVTATSTVPSTRTGTSPTITTR
jgi:adhesin/invasin